MTKRKRTVGLLALLKGSSNPKDLTPGCANYDHHYGGCLFCVKGCDVTNDECLQCDDFQEYSYCLVERGQRCGYFEKAALPTAADLGLSELVKRLYGKNAGIANDGSSQREPGRRCPGTDRHECGAPLPPRRKYCDKCRGERRRDSYRRRRGK